MKLMNEDLIDIGRVPKEQRVDAVLNKEKISRYTRGNDGERPYGYTLAYNFKNPYPNGKPSLPIRVLNILKNGSLYSRNELNTILGVPSRYFSNLYNDMFYFGFIDRVKDPETGAPKYKITDSGLKYLRNAK